MCIHSACGALQGANSSDGLARVDAVIVSMGTDEDVVYAKTTSLQVGHSVLLFSCSIITTLLIRIGLKQCFSNFFILSPPFHPRHVVFAPKSDKANTR